MYGSLLLVELVGSTSPTPHRVMVASTNLSEGLTLQTLG
jgi:hypothetical protein